MRLAVLDLAGTAVVDDGLVLDAVDHGLRAVRAPVAGPRYPALRRQAQAAADRPSSRLFADLLDGDLTRARRAAQAFEAHLVAAAREGRLPAVPGGREAAAALRDAGLAVALVCGLDPATRTAVTRAAGWDGHVDLQLSPSDVGGRGLPEPDLVLRAAARLDVDPAQVVVAGDATGVMVAAARAGAGLAIGVRGGAHGDRALRAAGAHDLVDSLADLPARLGLPQLAGAALRSAAG